MKLTVLKRETRGNQGFSLDLVSVKMYSIDEVLVLSVIVKPSTMLKRVVKINNSIFILFTGNVNAKVKTKLV